jgi:acetylglutamate kinase
MTDQHKRTVQTLLEAMPYIRRFWGATIVVVYGGIVAASARLRAQFAADLALLRMVGMQPLVVEVGDGKDVAAFVDAQGAEAAVVDARGDQLTLIPAATGTTATATEGDTVSTAVVTEVHTMLALEAVPVVALGGAGTPAESAVAAAVAGALAAALRAEKIVFVSDEGGLVSNLGSDPSVVSECDLAYVGALTAVGHVPKETLPTLAAVRQALEAGVTSAHLIDGRVEHALLLEIMTDAGCGTKIVQ